MNCPKCNNMLTDAGWCFKCSDYPRGQGYKFVPGDSSLHVSYGKTKCPFCSRYVTADHTCLGVQEQNYPGPGPAAIDDKPPGFPPAPIVNDITAKAIILAAEALIGALSCMTSNYDNGRSKAIATIGEALLHDAKEAGIL